MRLFVSLLLLGFMTSVQAATAETAEGEVVFEGTSRYEGQDLVGEFYVHNRTGRAYIRVMGLHYCYPHDPMGCPVGSKDLFRVPNLEFDPTIGKKGAVVYRAENETIVCAYRRFGPEKETGRCVIEVEPVRRRQYTVRLRIL